MEGGAKEDMAIKKGGMVATKEEGMVAIKEEGMVAIKDMLLGTMVAVTITLPGPVLGNRDWSQLNPSMLEIFSSMSKKKISEKNSRPMARLSALRLSTMLEA